HVDHLELAVEEDRVDRELHEARVERRAADEQKPFVPAEALAAEEAAQPETEGVRDDAALADDTVFGFDPTFSPRHPLPCPPFSAGMKSALALDPPTGPMLAVFAFVLPGLAYLFLATLWAMRVLQQMLTNARR